MHVPNHALILIRVFKNMTGQRSLTVVTAPVTVVATTLTNFNSFPTSSKKIFAILFNKQVKRTKTTMGMLHKRLGITAQKMKFSIKDFFSKCDQMCRRFQGGKVFTNHVGISNLFKAFIVDFVAIPVVHIILCV